MVTKYLSPEGLEKIKAELQNLIEVKRPEVINRIAEAKEQGDLKENAEYHEARESQAFIEGRILELQNLIRNSIVIDPSKQNSDDIQIGCQVKIDCNGNKMDYQIVGTDEADPTNGKISHESPMGKAFLGKKIGDMVEINVPAGKLNCKILHICY